MKPEIIEFIGQARKPRSEKFRVQFSVFIVCLALSIFLWGLVRLSKDYFYTLHYKMTFTQIPGNLSVISYSDSILVIKIKLQGFDFFSEEFVHNQERFCDVSLKNLRLQGSGEKIRGYLLTNRIGKEIVSQSEFPNDIFLISPDTLFFNLERHILKKIPSKPVPGMIESPGQRKDTILLLHNNTLKIKK